VWQQLKHSAIGVFVGVVDTPDTFALVSLKMDYNLNTFMLAHRASLTPVQRDSLVSLFFFFFFFFFFALARPIE
jgi:hypothetical protein